MTELETQKMIKKTMLENIFGNCATLMKKDSTIYVRTDSREFTFQTTLEILQQKFPYHSVKVLEKPVKHNIRTQTEIYNNSSKFRCEKDIILTRNQQ